MHTITLLASTGAARIDQALRDCIGLIEQQREVATSAIDPGPYMKDVNIDDAAVKAYYDANSAALQTPEQAKFEYVILSQDSLMDGTAADPTRTFNRFASVALGHKDFGDVRVGRYDTISRTLAAFYDPSDKGQIKIDETGLYEVFGSRTDNTVAYLSPSWGGFQLLANVAAGEGAPNARYEGVALTFRSGPIAVAAGYEEFHQDDTYNKAWSIGGNYNFGFATLFAAYQKTDEHPGQQNWRSDERRNDHRFASQINCVLWMHGRPMKLCESSGATFQPPNATHRPGRTTTA